MSGENDVTPVARAEFIRLLDVQEAKGVETYGTTLQAGNGRDALNDAAEELVDAFKYVMQARMERERVMAALPDPGKLWALATWLDERFPDESNPEVQRDLRAWSRAIYALDPERFGKCVVPAILGDNGE